MKTCLFLLCTIVLSPLLFAQQHTKIDSSNYYDYYSDGQHITGKTITTDWLGQDDAISLIVGEMEKAGYKDWFSDLLYQLPDSQMVVLTAYHRKPEFGFLYIGDHAADPEKAHRTAAFWKVEQDYIFSQRFYRPGGHIAFRQVKELPENIFILREDCYWFQYTDNKMDNAKLVTKQIALAILRQDIRTFLARVKK